ncbi:MULTISPECIES: HalOD1 output domain-containing protein [Haloferax]|nr:HalOD1 output domain-containing protein [Haloferax mediterranei]
MSISGHESPKRTRVWYDCERDESVSEAILTATSEHKACEPTELAPLGEYADTDALDTLFGAESSFSPSLSNGNLEFEYDDVVVKVDTMGVVEIIDPD